MPKRAAVILLPFLLACGGGGDQGERIETVGAPIDEETYIHDTRTPRIRLEQIESVEGLAVPDLPGGALFWRAELPYGSEGTARPAILVATDAEGGLIERTIWIDDGGEGDFTGGLAAALSPYEDYEGWYETGPIEVSYTVDRPEGSVRGTALCKGLLNVYPGGARFRVSPEEGRSGTIAAGARFLLYDGDRNGIYEMDDPLVIDANGDGTFDGNRNSVELYSMSEPFLIGGQGYRIESVAWDGSEVVITPTDEFIEPRIPLLAGDPAPDFTLPGLDGEPVRFGEESAGRPVLLAYWATW